MNSVARITGDAYRDHDGELERAKIRRGNAMRMRRWLSREMGKPALMNLKGNPNIERDINRMLQPGGNSFTHADVMEKRADNAEYRLCRAIRVKIGVAEFEEWIDTFTNRCSDARELKYWWNEHKRADAAREEQERVYHRQRIAHHRNEIARHEREMAALAAD